MKFPRDIRRLLSRRFQSRRCEWLAGGGAWPLEARLGVPTENQARARYDTVRDWAKSWAEWRGVGELAWVERRWRNLGAQRLPAKLTLAGPGQVAEWVEESARWERAARRYQTMLERRPGISGRVEAYFDMLADYNEADFDRLGRLIDWLCENPATGLYPRQLPIAGLDSKWLESRKGMAADLIEAARGLPRQAGDFYRRCGLSAPPRLTRLRLLDRRLQKRLGGLSDVCAPWRQLSELDLPVARVLVVENTQTGLACEALPGAVVVMGLGYDVDVLARLPWVKNADCVYWGDIDTHGFAILSRARAIVPAIRSALMDRETLDNHRDLWVEEKTRHRAPALPQLTDAEQEVYRALKGNVWGRNIRLEQERIAWDYAWGRVRRLFE